MWKTEQILGETGHLTGWFIDRIGLYCMSGLSFAHPKSNAL